MFKKLDQSKEVALAKEREKEAKREKSPVPRKERTSIVFGTGSGAISPRQPRIGSQEADPDSVSPRNKSGQMRKVSTPMIRASGRRKSGEIPLEHLESLQFEKTSVVLPEKPTTPADRMMSKQPRRLSRVNPNDVKRLYEGPTFGVPLAHQMYIGYEEFVIPPILHKTTAFLRGHLEVEGLFRVSGSQDEIAEWKALFNAGKPVSFGPGTSPHSVAGLLKAWLRELPEPLLTYQMFDKWMEVATVTLVHSPEEATPVVKQLLLELPDINLAVLREMFIFLSKVVQMSSKNLMTAENVGVVIGPNILSKENQDALASATVMPAAVQLAAFLAKSAEELFES